VKRAVPVALSALIMFYILPLGIRPLMIPDETRYAEIPREMLQTGDWVVPRLDGLRYFEKPVLGYWIEAGAQSLFGQNRFAARFPSALSALLTAWMLFILVRRFGGGRLPGITAFFICLTSLEVFLLGTFNVLDGLFSLFLTAAMVLFFFAHRETGPWKKGRLLALSGASCGLAFLTKGFLAFAIPVAAVVPYMIMERRTKELLRVFLIPAVSALLVALPWSLAVFRRAPDFWRHFFWVEHIRRFFSGDPQHPQPFWFFVPVLLAGALPWSLLFPAAFRGLKGRRPMDPLTRFALCWLLFPFILLSASHGKLITYILPCYPPLAVLLASGLHAYPAKEEKKAFTAAAPAAAGLAALLAAFPVFIRWTRLPGVPGYGPGEAMKWAAASLLLLGAALFFLFSARSGQRENRPALYTIAACLMLASIYFSVPDRILQARSPGPFLLSHKKEATGRTILVSEGGLAPALCWYYKRNDVLILEDEAGELKYGLGYPDAEDHGISLGRLAELVRETSGTGRRVVLVGRTRLYESWRKVLPEPVSEEKDVTGTFIIAGF